MSERQAGDGSVARVGRAVVSRLAMRGDFWRESAVLVLLVLVSETLHLVWKNSAFLPALGVSAVRVALAYVAAWAAVATALGLAVRSATARSLLFSIVVYAALSAKVLAIDASFLHHPAPLAAFVVASCALFGVAHGGQRLLRDTLVYPAVVLVGFNALKCLGHGWATRGGNLRAFLLAKETVAVVAIAGLALGAFALLAARARRAVGFAATAVAAAMGAWIFATSEDVVAQERRSSASGRPDVVVISFDALRKDVFDARCRVTKSPGLRALCERGRRYEHVLSSGLGTYVILTRNLAGDRPCPESVPGRLGAQGYTTAMYLGRKLINIAGAFCFDRYFSGENRTLLEGYAAPSLVSALGSLGADTPRAKYIDSRELFETFARDPVAERHPLFVYFHFLDLHAPCVPKALAADAPYLSTLGEFMARCFAEQCDFSSAEGRRLVEEARRGYLAGLSDVEESVDRVLDHLRRRGRPFRLILTADHGELFGEHGGIAHQGGFVEEILSIPFVVYDSDESQTGQDCRLLSSSEAIGEASQFLAPAHAANRTRLRIEGAPLGDAVVDLERGAIEYSVAPAMLEHRGTWRNVHRELQGSVPFRGGRCAATVRR
ncbi:MAG: sulfatase-like hydrolase/transferase [Polyangiaceae bacterium]|nr:sulfatase-like hydrolase/transferase [Polyangiaceae bacterium]